MIKSKFKRGDKVIVIAGSFKGKVGDFTERLNPFRLPFFPVVF